MSGAPLEAPDEVRRVVFLGTPDAAVPALEALVAAGFDVPLVVTRPDRRRGRGSSLVPSPVKRAGLDLGLTVTDDLAAVTELQDHQPADLGVVVAYGRIIPVSVLERLAMVNIHFSLLPRWRGAAPVERAILAGDRETGVCLMEVAEGLDEGGIHAVRRVDIGEQESAADLRRRLADIGAELLVSSLTDGLGPAEPQVGEVTYAAKIERDEHRLDLTRTAIELARTVRLGRAWAEFRGRRLVVEEATAHPAGGTGSETAAGADPERADEPAGCVPDGPPGTLHGTSVLTGDGVLELRTVKPEGKRSMAAAAWVNGVRPEPGERLA